MIKIENTETFGWEAAIRGMRNPMNSWNKSDSEHICESCEDPWGGTGYILDTGKLNIGTNDLDLMKRLRNAGTDHRKYMRMITVYCDVTAPLYWWKEFDTYKVGTVANSCSTMHKIHTKEFTLNDFSHEHMFSEALKVLETTISTLEFCRHVYLNWDEYKDTQLPTGIKTKKDLWWQMIQLLPSSYNQKRTVMMNYEVLANIYPSRKNHKLDEWHDFCDWIKALPYSELITGEEKREKE